MKLKQVHFFVSGRVQGIFYRHNTIKKARALGLKGFVRNTSEGRVEVFAEGEDKKADELVAFCRNNPGLSMVENIEIIEEKYVNALNYREFKVNY